MRGVHIRPAVKADSAWLAHIQVDSYRAAYAGILPEEYLAAFSYAEQEQDWRDWPVNHPQDLLLVAETETRQVVGYALARPGLTKLPPYDGELLAMHIRSDHQRQGIGRAMFVEAARLLHSLGCKSLLVWVLDKNLPAIQFYERMGGNPVARQVIELENGGENPVELAFGWLNITALWD